MHELIEQIIAKIKASNNSHAEKFEAAVRKQERSGSEIDQLAVDLARMELFGALETAAIVLLRAKLKGVNLDAE